MQTEIPETRPTSCSVPNKRAPKILLDMGGYEALTQAKLELEEMRTQHPGIAGLTLAIAVVSRRAAEKQMDSSRAVLVLASEARMPIENHAIALDFTDDGLRLKAMHGPDDHP